jgi:drug/metabolite transporter (DMT)-like permease
MGVISKIFASSTLPKTSAEGYSVWIALCTIILSALVLLILYKKDLFSFSWSATGLSAIGGISTRVANLWLVIALANVDASVQYPMVTGGTMIVSTLYCFIGGNKPKPREIISVTVAFLGMLALLIK